ncbi:MAG: hypothetical protein U9Q33_11135 [Campylobacterota bacterium]|nr:hypothetical protein [Campylobacterota bacterium]
MVRLINTECFYDRKDLYCSVDIDLTNSQEVYGYDNFNKISIMLPKDELNGDQFYSLNSLSQKRLEENQFLIYINNKEFCVLYDHKTIYYSKIAYTINDLIKSFLITKHLLMLLSIGSADKVYCVIDSPYKKLYKELIVQNMKSTEDIKIVDLGDIDEIVRSLPQLNTKKNHIIKYLSVSLLVLFSTYFVFFGLKDITNKFYPINDLTNLTVKLKKENRLLKKNETLLKSVEEEYKYIKECISKENEK